MVKKVSREELKAKMDRGERFTLVETLPEQMYVQGHLPGALNLPPDLVRNVAPLRLPDKGAEIILYCGGST